MSLLNSSFHIIYTIHKIFTFLENQLKHLRYNIFEKSLRSRIDFYLKKKDFFTKHNYGKSNNWRRKKIFLDEEKKPKHLKIKYLEILKKNLSMKLL